MKSIPTYLVLFLLFFSTSLKASNGMVYVTKEENNQKVIVPMMVEIDGAVKLFSMSVSDKKVVRMSEANFKEIVLNTRKEYYISTGYDVEIITSGNFRKLAKKYFKDTTEILKRIGKRGFRYENLPSIILYHNKRKAKGQSLTKRDLQRLSVLQ